MRENDRGLSLVELVVAVAIVAIVGSAIIGFLSTCLRQYQAGNAEAAVQSEAQLVGNQIENLILNTTEAVGYVESTDTHSLWIISSDQTAVRIYEDCNVCQIFYQRYSWTKSGSQYVMETVSGENSQLMGEYVTDMSVDLNSLEAKQTVTISLSFSLQKRTYDTSKTVSLRNDVALANQILLK